MRDTAAVCYTTRAEIRSEDMSGMRHELKYIIDKGTYFVLKGRLARIMREDPHGGKNGEGYRVTSLYFDNIYGEGYFDKLNGVKTRRKFRIRSYNLSPERITLEVKHKEGSYVWKNSSPLTKEQYYSMLGRDYSFMKNMDGEKNAFGEFYRSDLLTRLSPKVIVDYFRYALIFPFGNVRITFDKTVSMCYNSVDMFGGEAMFSPVMPEEIILEIKYDNYLPTVILDAVRDINSPRCSVSKYVICSDCLGR